MGDVFSSGDFKTLSDARLKTDIQNITDPLEKALRLRGCTYRRNDVIGDDEDIRRRICMGVIAQETRDVLPEAVYYDEKHDLHSVNYHSVVALLIEAIKDMRAEYTREITNLQKAMRELSLERE
jgi:hypothetical protein